MPHHWRPVPERSEGGGGVWEFAVGGLRERSQFAGAGLGTEEVEVLVEGPNGCGLGLCVGAAEFGIGAVPGAFEGGDLALDADQEFGGWGLGEEYGSEGVAGRFGEDGVGEVSLDALEAALLPIGAEHGIDVEGFGGGLGAELVVVVGGERVVIGGVFAGDDDGSGVKAMFEGVEAGGGLALDGAGSGGLLGVGLVGGDLCWGCHDYDLACGWRETWSGGR